VVDGVEGHSVNLDEDLFIVEDWLGIRFVDLEVLFDAAFRAVVLPGFHRLRHLYPLIIEDWLFEMMELRLC
jgi:hypothetical protein